jgi:hypothetical protein
MAKRAKAVRTKISDSLERITLPASSYFTSEFVFSGDMDVICPRCKKLSTIVSATIGLTLACGCRWFEPDKNRPTDKQAWVSYAKE